MFLRGSDPGDAHGIGIRTDALLIGFTVASPETGAPAPRFGAPLPKGEGIFSLLPSLIPSPSPEWRRGNSNLPSPLGRGEGVREGRVGMRGVRPQVCF